MSRRAGALAALAALAVAVAAPLAGAHGGGIMTYRSVITSNDPALPGLSAAIVDRDDRIRLTNGSDRTLVVLGYEGEPYLRFDAGGGVWENRRSPAAYENAQRYGVGEPPAAADARTAPQWDRVSSSRTYEWHDHRIHWMSPIPPPAVKAAPERERHIFDWRVPGRAGVSRVVISGTLSYVPRTDDPNWTLIAASALAGAAAVGTVLARTLLRQRQA